MGFFSDFSIRVLKLPDEQVLDDLQNTMMLVLHVFPFENLKKNKIKPPAAPLSS